MEQYHKGKMVKKRMKYFASHVKWKIRALACLGVLLLVSDPFDLILLCESKQDFASSFPVNETRGMGIACFRKFDNASQLLKPAFISLSRFLFFSV